MAESTPTPLTLEFLTRLVTGEAVAIRGSATLEPAGGPGDKVFPPTHSVRGKKDEDLWRMAPHERTGIKYARETRRINGLDTPCVLLDSVQSQANRMEEALQTLWSESHISLPVIQVDLAGSAPDVGIVLRTCTIDEIKEAVSRIAGMPADELRNMSERSRLYAQTHHSRENFARAYREIVRSLAAVEPT